jgi:O-antigen biosynthesis protein WbqV
MMLTFSVDLVMAAVSIAMSAGLVWYFSAPRPSFSWSSFCLTVPVFVLSAAGSLLLRGIPKQVWRHMGRPDTVALLQAAGLASLVSLAVFLLLNGRVFSPILTLVVAAPLFIFSLLLARSLALYRSTSKPLQFVWRNSRGQQPVVLIGDDSTCSNVLKRLQDSEDGSRLHVLGVVESGSRHPGRSIRGVSVFGSVEKLGEIIAVLKARYGTAPWLAVTGQARERESMLAIIKVASETGTKVMALGTHAAMHRLMPIDTADLLARPVRQLDPQPVHDLVKDARVLVTGGGGTIGAELARQTASFEPRHLSILDASEFNLYSIDLALSELHPKIPRSLHLGDVRDTHRINDVFERAEPEVVIHAAALKHVPLMEHNLCEAILTNVFGAVQTARRAVLSGARRFVFISTDKAVDPDNVMGATKRLAEIALSRIAVETGLAVSIVRFGNVLGSSGSVVPLFEHQIARGGPVTVTNPDATRYFMTLEEASSLVLQAAALQGNPGEAGLFVLDMGEPIKIGQLAESMIRMKGLVPNVDIMIEEKGLREGEKMHEALVYDDEELFATQVDGVNRVVLKTENSEFFEKRLGELFAAASARDEPEARRLLSVLVPEYAPDARLKGRRLLA